MEKRNTRTTQTTCAISTSRVTDIKYTQVLICNCGLGLLIKHKPFNFATTLNIWGFPCGSGNPLYLCFAKKGSQRMPLLSLSQLGSQYASIINSLVHFTASQTSPRNNQLRKRETMVHLSKYASHKC